ncbi:HNH endonuclease [Kribbella sp. VKM Ac-2527]|uniref:HNH endonuclease n=1 Tax=Kribbella caucasensis TaxID=2512215 RepID=A0A4V3CAG9_9ACTN|nr:HNH endonuclease signature motif containing protein [Kribbella sp. VKM Ac-2527]TDO50688.1 HNH endonuclease [Kribbella sp. VKM Ac-2527]
MDRWYERPVWSMTGSDKLTALDTLQADLTRLSTRRLELLAALDTDGYATEIGARDTVNLIAIRHRLDPTDVRRDLKLAHALPKYPAVSTALHTDPTTTPTDAESPAPAEETAANAETATDAEAEAERAGQAAADAIGVADVDGAADAERDGPSVLHPGQAAVIVDALEKIPSSARVSAESLRFAEEQMVKAAQVLPPGELRKLGREVRNRLDTDGPEPAEKRAAANERLWLKRTDDGIKFGGFLAGDNAELLQTMVFANSKPHKTPDGQRDPRSRGKLQADGFTDILHTAAATGVAPAHGGIRPHITVTISLADLLAGTGTGDLAHGGTLSAAAIRRLACDAGIIPLVLGANSEPLDVGTEERFVNRAMRRALNARDKGCVVCGAPPAMCEAHHIIHWAEGGPTRVDNLVLLCKAHHIDVHHGHWTIEMVNGRPVLSRPDWATPTPTRTPTSPDPWADNPGRTPTAPPDPWATSPSNTPPAGSPAPASSGDSPETPPGAGPPTPEPAPETPPGAGPPTPEPAPNTPPGARPITPEPWPTTLDAGAGTTAARSTGSATTPAGSSSRATTPAAPAWARSGRDPADYPDPRADEPPTGATLRDADTTGLAREMAAAKEHPVDQTSGPADHAAWPTGWSPTSTERAITPPGGATRRLGGFAHPLGDSTGNLDIMVDQLRREVADYPDPWSDDPSPQPTVPPTTASASPPHPGQATPAR